jgi:hypothetical protein
VGSALPMTADELKVKGYFLMVVTTLVVNDSLESSLFGNCAELQMGLEAGRWVISLLLARLLSFPIFFRSVYVG